MLTGCVAPNIKNDVLAITDINIRKQQYLNAIKWYSENTPFKIVFCENSGYDLSDEIALLGGQIEFLSFTASSEGAERGKGYKEMEILEYIHQNSDFCKEADLLVKITGRLVLLNIVNLVRCLDGQKQEFVSAYLYGRRYFSDSRFIFFSPKFFPLLLAQKENIVDWKHNFEYYTFAAVMQAQKQGIRFVYPSLPERVHGIGGGFGVTYDVSDWTYFKLNIRHQLKRFLFQIGILPRVK